jgi:hypothetical protein
MRWLFPLLCRLLAALLVLQSAGAAAACLRLAGGAMLAVEICAADGGARSIALPWEEPAKSPHGGGFCPACHALPAAPAPSPPLALPLAPPLPGPAQVLLAAAVPLPAAPSPYPATGPPAA